ncbi:MAG: ATP-binding cassette domain-containing protein [Planctomycetes bacterium]|nr:ATP-binding cassette domain-containing protein [Planctomycetota bacterium]
MYPTPGREIAIRFEDVHKGFGEHQVLRGLSFEVARGSTFVIMGPSGIGKSVTLKHVLGLLRPDRGRVWVEGQEPARMNKKELAVLRKGIGYLFQDGALINWLSVFDNVALPLRETWNLNERDVHARVLEALERVSLAKDGAKMPSDLSGGMRKRVGLARAIVARPRILLYDEPNAGLDPRIAGSINRLIRQVQHDLEVTSVVVTHRRECALSVGDRIAFFENGTIYAEGTVPEMQASRDPAIHDYLT